MPIRDRILWGASNPFSDPRLAQLDWLVREIRAGRLPPFIAGGRVFENFELDLPDKPLGYYREYDVQPTRKGQDRGMLRIVLGQNGEIYITGNHYRDFRQILGLPM